MPLMMPAAVTNFYPRPPHGGRLTSTLLVISPAIFLSTPSSRRATCAHGPVSFSPIFLSTPSSRRATSVPMVRYRFRPYFYPRPPHGGRHESSSEGGGQSNFYPRPAQKAADHPRISIHALLTEGDNIGSGRPSGRTYFYPRPPHGGRPLSCMTFFWPLDFYPRPPRGGRRFQDAVDVVPLTFLSTPSARRETSCQRGLCPPGGYFYPRPPRGGRPCRVTAFARP